MKKITLSMSAAEREELRRLHPKTPLTPEQLEELREQEQYWESMAELDSPSSRDLFNDIDQRGW